MDDHQNGATAEDTAIDASTVVLVWAIETALVGVDKAIDLCHGFAARTADTRKG